MCSIAGIISPDPGSVDLAILENINTVLAHRGPDGKGYYLDQCQGFHVGLSHNRLAVVDLSSSSAQPFRYNNRYLLVYNGEIYNYPELRSQLEQKGYRFQTTGDTEVLAAAFDKFGPACLEHLDGMFAFAIWDEKDCRLFCARDRFGEKPLYYHYDEGRNRFYFSSEIKGLFAAGIHKREDHVMLYNYLTLGFTKRADQPGKTFYENIFQLPASHYLEFDPRIRQLELSRYWDLDKESSSPIKEEQALEEFSHLLNRSVARRLRSDISIGTSLSGGLDSSSIAALIRDQPADHFSYQSFSAIFPGFEKDEGEKITSLAKHLHLRSNTIIPDAQGLADHLVGLLNDQDEPFGSSSVFAQSLVYTTAKEHGIKVLLDGQGADEVLAGYTRYTHWYLQELVKQVGWTEASRQAKEFEANHFLEHWGWKNRVAAALPSLTARHLERRALEQQKKYNYIDREFVSSATDKRSIYKPLVEKLNDIQYFDLMVMGLEELLRYADRNAMAEGVEVRLPFLSHELVQYIFTLPPGFRMRGGYTKWILRKMMEDKLPKEICWQKGKTGFEPPQKIWMQQASVQDLLREARKKLVEKKICSSSLLNKTIVPACAHEADNFDFRCLVAGNWIS